LIYPAYVGQASPWRRGDTCSLSVIQATRVAGYKPALLESCSMKTIEPIRDFLDAFVHWASDQPDVQAIALVGSYARGAARYDADIDLVILTDQPSKYPDDIK